MHKPPSNKAPMLAAPRGEVESATVLCRYRGSNLRKFDPDPRYAQQGWRRPPSPWAPATETALPDDSGGDTERGFQFSVDPVQMKSEQDAGSIESSSTLSSLPSGGDGESGRHGLPSRLRAGIEALSGMDLSDVVVHRNSPEPARLSALAYAKGDDIYLGAGQEQHLPHEAWHVVQQRQGRVKPTVQMKDVVGVNDDTALEQEADKMGTRALQGAAPLMAGAGRPAVGPSTICIQLQAKLGDPITSDGILAFLAEVAAEGGEVSTGDQEAIMGYIRHLSRARNRDFFLAYDALYRKARYVEGGVIHRVLFESSQKAKPTRKRGRAEDDKVVEVFSDADSEDSEGEMDVDSLYADQSELFQQAVDHSDFHQVKDVINPRNTNMLTFLGRSLIPSSINGTANIKATRKSKRKLAKRLRSQKEALRTKQEQVYFGSHLGYEQDGKFGETIKELRRSVASGKEPAKAVQKLLTTSRKGFTITNTETHAEQSLLFSKTWDALKASLIESIKHDAGPKGLMSAVSQGDTLLVTILLNRSSCRGCGLALSLALIEFWTQLGKALGEESGEGAYWEQIKKKYGSRVRFVARFPTIYEFSREKGIDFANLKEVLASMMSVGWEVAPVETHIQGGKESHDQLNAALKALGALPSDKDLAFYKSGGASTKGAQDPPLVPRVQPPASANRVDLGNLQAFLNAIAPGWNMAFAYPGGDVAAQGAGGGYMAHQIAPAHRDVAAPLHVDSEREGENLAARHLRVSRNSGSMALCFVYSILMGLTGQTEDEVRDMVLYVAEQARVGGGWINADSEAAARVVGVIEGIYGQIDVVVVQHGAEGMIISGRAGHIGRQIVVIRQTIGHYDAYVPAQNSS